MNNMGLLFLGIGVLCLVGLGLYFLMGSGGQITIDIPFLMNVIIILVMLLMFMFFIVVMFWVLTPAPTWISATLSKKLILPIITGMNSMEFVLAKYDRKTGTLDLGEDKAGKNIRIPAREAMLNLPNNKRGLFYLDTSCVPVSPAYMHAAMKLKSMGISCSDELDVTIEAARLKKSGFDIMDMSPESGMHWLAQNNYSQDFIDAYQSAYSSVIAGGFVDKIAGDSLMALNAQVIADYQPNSFAVATFKEHEAHEKASIIAQMLKPQTINALMWALAFVMILVGAVIVWQFLQQGKANEIGQVASGVMNTGQQAAQQGVLGVK